MFGKRENSDNATHETFVKEVRSKIEKNMEDATCETSTGICVFEHNDESALDDEEKAVLEKLKAAHEAWQAANNPTETEDAYASVRVKVR